jgi:predicted metal-binding membrane protein
MFVAIWTVGGDDPAAMPMVLISLPRPKHGRAYSRPDVVFIGYMIVQAVAGILVHALVQFGGN